MEWDLVFFTNSLLLGVGLAMDAFSVSMANGLRQPEMSRGRMAGIAGIFAGFQAAMPLAGWVCVHTVLEAFQAFEGSPLDRIGAAGTSAEDAAGGAARRGRRPALRRRL